MRSLQEERSEELSEDELQRLGSLGYLGFGPDTGAESASGVVARRPDCTCSGYDLLTYPALGRAELIDTKGRVARAWFGASERWERASFTPDGDLLVLARAPVDGETGERERRQRLLVRLSFDGDRVWERVLPAHHYVETLPDGRLATLTSRSRRIPELFGGTAVIDNGLAVLSPDGSTIETERSFYDMLRNRPGLVELDTFPDDEDRARRDFLHANFFQWMPGGALARRDPLYAGRNVLVTFRRQDALVIFDLARSRAIWAWGQGEVIGPHDAKVLRNGHILLFDNRTHDSRPREDGWSRILEIDPLNREVVWEYRADPPEAFYSHSRGTVERLESGNTLICSSNQGRVFEVTPDGDVVWEYRTPRHDGHGDRAVFRAERYPRTFVEPLLRGLTPDSS